MSNNIELYVDKEGFVPYGHDFGSKKELNEILLSLKREYEKTNEIEYLSDQGIILIILGKYQEAIDLYKKIESIKPYRYSTASSIGTAYELIGNNKEALKWIRKAVEIDPQSHFGSEWIHINILKSKVEGKPITSENLIAQNFGNEKIPQSDLSLEQLELLKKQIYYQLNERVSFVKPKDEIVARLLFDLGNVAYLIADHEDALEDFKLAEKYGFNDPILEQRIILKPKVLTKPAEIKELNKETKQIKPKEKSYRNEILVSVIVLGLLGFIVFVSKKKN
ncbi:tetratricopeptide repeat protein [Chryseobacterium terrae]|uniref:Tetratricopeptide repeat protein n=1 Tax=Chryseobacterium terrae TaxID=3163299 RepID=A0ABW8Y4W4_9FLAO